MFAFVYDLLMEDVDYEALYQWLKPYLLDKELIADVGCGSGYLLKELLMAGHHAIGFDVDSSMLSIARERLLEEGLPLEIYEHDIRKPLKHRFDGMVAMFDVMNYFKGLKTVFNRLAHALNEDGILIFDMYKESVLTDYDGYVERETDPIPYTWTIEAKGRILKHTVSVSKDCDVIVQYVHRLEDVKDALVEVGFEVEVKEGVDSRKHYIIARK